MEEFRDVLAFHKKFGLPVGEVPRVMQSDARKFRSAFLFEELDEMAEAWREGNLVKVADALLDYEYVVLGTALFIGCPHSYDFTSQWSVQAAAVGAGIDLPTKPQLLNDGLQTFFMRAMNSHTRMMLEAHDAGEVWLALSEADLCGIRAFQAATLMGVPWKQCWRHVQAANMAKKRAEPDGSDSKRLTAWDVVKPAGWKAPDSYILVELELAGWKAPDVEVNHATGKVEFLK